MKVKVPNLYCTQAFILVNDYPQVFQTLSTTLLVTLWWNFQQYISCVFFAL